jgi:hypothetical protein
MNQFRDQLKEGSVYNFKTFIVGKTRKKNIANDHHTEPRLLRSQTWSKEYYSYSIELEISVNADSLAMYLALRHV